MAVWGGADMDSCNGSGERSDRNNARSENVVRCGYWTRNGKEEEILLKTRVTFCDSQCRRKGLGCGGLVARALPKCMALVIRKWPIEWERYDLISTIRFTFCKVTFPSASPKLYFSSVSDGDVLVPDSIATAMGIFPCVQKCVVQVYFRSPNGSFKIGFVVVLCSSIESCAVQFRLWLGDFQ